jgi:hypothetical protein
MHTEKGREARSCLCLRDLGVGSRIGFGSVPSLVEATRSEKFGFFLEKGTY